MTRAREIADLAGLLNADSTGASFEGSTTFDTSTLFIDGVSDRVGVGTTSPYKKLEVVGDIQLDATDANIWIKSGATGTNGFINWTFNTDGTVYNKIGMDYDTRASTGFHIDAGYPITIDATASAGKAINFDIGGVTKAVIDGVGNVGIGTTSPDTLLHVKATDNAGVTLESTDGSRKWLIRNNQGTNDGLVLRNATAGTDVVIIDDGAGANSLVVEASGNVSVGASSIAGGSLGVNHALAGTYPKASGIGLGAVSTAYTVASNGGTVSFTGGAGLYAENTALSGNPTNLVFWTNLAGTPAEAMRISSSGNVGIGTSSPAAALHVNGDNIANTFKLIANTSVSGSDATIFRPADNTMAFSTNGSERMRISTAGQVTMPYQSSFWAWYGSVNPITSAQYITFQNVDLNVGGHYSTSTGRYTAPVNGVYEFQVMGLFRQNSYQQECEITLYVNGSNVSTRGLVYGGYGATAVGPLHIPVSFTYRKYLSAGDYAQPYVHAVSGGADIYTDQRLSWFTGRLIG